MRLMLIGLVSMTLAGCGTITRGSSEQVTFNSEPAGAHVQTSIGYSCPATPCTYDVPRKSEFVATFSMPGYQTQEIPVTTKISGNGGASFAGNVLVGGLVGMAADASTGAAYDHTPNPVFAKLLPSTVASSRVSSRRRTARRRSAVMTAPTQ